MSLLGRTPEETVELLEKILEKLTIPVIFIAIPSTPEQITKLLEEALKKLGKL